MADAHDLARTDERFLPSGDEAGTSPEDRAFRPDVEGLRAVAILLVVLFHVGIPQLHGGLIGVDVFFVISGFVITGLLLREHASTGRTDFLSFYARRARRILPAALLVIVVTLVAAPFLVDHPYGVLVASDARWVTVFVGNFHFASVTPSIITTRPASPFQNYWSLAVEEQFYLVYPAFFAGLLVIPGRLPVRARLGIGLALAIAASFGYSVASSHSGSIPPFMSPLTRAWELAIGASVAVLTPALLRLPRVAAASVTWIGAGLIGVALAFIGEQTPFPGWAAAVPVLGAALIVAGGTVAPRWGTEIVLGSPLFRWIGRRSYSWYLWHWPVLVLAAAYSGTSILDTSIAKNLALAALALVLASVTYSAVENPIRRSRRLRANAKASLVGAVLLIVSCVALTFAF